jgi:Protein of unknown function (DUF4199)
MQEQQRTASIVSIATKYGLIEGVLSFIVFLIQARIGTKQNWTASVINAALLIVLMVLAHREFKRTHGGMMTYAQGLGSGTLLGSAAAVVTSVLVYVYVKYINTGFIAAAIQAQRAAVEQRGITGARAQQAMAIMSAIMTPVGVFVTSLITAVILGFVVALIVSIFTQRGDPRVVV